MDNTICGQLSLDYTSCMIHKNCLPMFLNLLVIAENLMCLRHACMTVVNSGRRLSSSFLRSTHACLLDDHRGINLDFIPQMSDFYSSSSSSSTAVCAIRSKSRIPLCVILRPPFPYPSSPSSTCSSTPIFSSDCITLRLTLPDASTW